MDAWVWYCWHNKSVFYIPRSHHWQRQEISEYQTYLVVIKLHHDSTFPTSYLFFLRARDILISLSWRQMRYITRGNRMMIRILHYDWSYLTFNAKQAGIFHNENWKFPQIFAQAFGRLVIADEKIKVSAV